MVSKRWLANSKPTKKHTYYIWVQKRIIHMTNQVVQQMAKNLKKASVKNEAPIWAKMAEYAKKPSVARRTINIKKIDALTKADDVIVFPGKVLGTGNLSHKITLCSFSISNAAASKILDAGGKIINFEKMVESFPTGKGVTMLG